VAFARRKGLQQDAAEQASYGFEGSRESVAVVPILILILSTLSNAGGPWVVVPLLAIGYFVLTGITSLIGASDGYRLGLDHHIIELSTLRRGGKALNAVCGTGSLAVSFAKQMRPAEVQATDQWKPTRRNPDPAKRTRDNVRIEGVESIVTVRDVDPLSLPFAANQFNAVGSRYGMQNLRKKRTEAILEMVRVLRTGGSIVLAEALPWALWLQHRVMKRLEREYKVTDVRRTRYRFTFIISARKLG
jgi:SAM-dependent methyltransferase